MNSATIGPVPQLPRESARRVLARSRGSAVLRPAWPALLAIWVGVQGWAGCASKDDCNIETQTRDLGGAGLMDCGLASTDDTHTVDACAVAAFAGRNTFRAIYERSDGTLEALVHAAGDAYLTLRESPDGIERRDCKSAHVVDDADRSYVECVEPSAPTIVCN